MTATMTPVFATIDAVHHDLDDTATLTFAMPADLEMPTAGQFAMMWIPGVGEIPVSYSGIGEDRRVDHTIRSVGAASAALVALEAGDVVGIRGPFGRGWQLDDLSDRDLLIVAGGLGLAPVRPVIEAAAFGQLAARSTRVLIGARSPDDLVYADSFFDRWAALDVEVTVDSATSSWSGHVGRVTEILDDKNLDAGATTALVCGPEIMMLFVAQRLTSFGVDARDVQVSVERNMQCAIGHCGRCQLGPFMTCMDGPVLDWDVAEPLLTIKER